VAEALPSRGTIAVVAPSAAQQPNGIVVKHVPLVVRIFVSVIPRLRDSEQGRRTDAEPVRNWLHERARLRNIP
jgi:hypothetical protein